ncbi:MAG: SCO6745 family protein [Aeromicrobium sp.]
MGTVRRQFWQGIEVIHDVVYFAPDIRERFEAVGLKGWWMAYFAQRSAALGTPGPGLVTALFHGFAPRLVERALPDAWTMADRDRILAARLELARDQLRPTVAGPDSDAAVESLARSLELIVGRLDFAGRPLAASHASVPRPDDPLGRLWWAATVLREYRGDSHVAILVAAGLDGAAANALAVADGRAPSTQQQARGWDDDEWMAAFEHLRRRAWVDEYLGVTDSGKAARAQIEDATDRVSSACFDEEMQARAITSEPALVDLARAINAADAVTFPNPTATFLP